MRLSNKASTLFLNNLRRIKGEIRTLFSQAPLPAHTERKSLGPAKDPKRRREADFGKETGAQDAEWLQSFEYFLKDGGGGSVIFI